MIKRIFLLFIFAGLIFLTSCGQEKQNDDPKEKEKVEYTITWKDDEGSTLTTTKVVEGTKPSYSWTKSDTVEFTYTFKGWSNEADGEVISIPNASSDATYYAVIESSIRQYTLTFSTNNDSIVEDVSTNYNTSVNKPEDPTFDGYKFMGWYVDSGFNTLVTWPLTITKNTTVYAKWNVEVDILGYLTDLLGSYEVSPYSYIPEEVTPGYSDNLVVEANVVSNYDSFVSKTNIESKGFGEQWNMVTENLDQSQTFFTVLNSLESIMSLSIVAFNNYLDENPEETAHHTFVNGIYSVTIDFNDDVMLYVLDYSATLPVLGQQTVQIYMSMDVETKDKEVRIQLGDANVMYYELTDSSYEFAIKYLGVRKAYFSIEEDDDGNIEGHISEYLTYSGIGLKSAASFYITEDYVTVIGNKAGGLPGFAGTICELYDTKTGKLVAYKVLETLSSITYQTIWFDMSDISGINSIKYVPKTESTDAKFYVNNLTSAWEARKVGGLSTKMLSRRYDIEFRNQYFYSYDQTNKVYNKVSVSVPMMFVQEEFLSTFTADVNNTNSSVNASISLSSSKIEKLQSEYTKHLDPFMTYKETITEDYIVSFIGDKVTFN